MNDEQLQPLLEVWLRDREVPRPDVQTGVARVMANVPRTRQQRRWLPFPVSHRKARPPTGTADYRPSPIPATNSHAPIVIGRTQAMLSPVKAVTVGALVFALGGVLFIAQPFDQGGSVPGAEQTTYPAPVYVTGTHVRLRECEDLPGEEYGPTLLLRTTCTDQHTWNDPRLQGTETFWNYCIDYPDDPSELTLCQRVINIVTDEGAWRMRPFFTINAGSPDGEVGDSSSIWVLDGEDAYEGLSVVLAKGEEGRSGFIVSSDLLPPAPEEGSTK
jgi:hypothetical protein